LTVEDFDNDGWSDLAAVNLNSLDVSILVNDASWTAVTINQAVGQADPTVGPTISFDVTFAAPVTGFDETDIDFTGSTVGGTPAAAVTGDGTIGTPGNTLTEAEPSAGEPPAAR